MTNTHGNSIRTNKTMSDNNTIKICEIIRPCDIDVKYQH